MIRVAIDSNILIYAEFEPDSEKGTRSADLILRAALDDAARQALLYQAVFLTPPTTDAIINTASELAHANRMQLWDCVVCAASAQAGAKVLLTEDMQDGRIINGLRLVNPFAAANAKAIDD